MRLYRNMAQSFQTQLSQRSVIQKKLPLRPYSNAQLAKLKKLN